MIRYIQNAVLSIYKDHLHYHRKRFKSTMHWNYIEEEKVIYNEIFKNISGI